MTAILPICPACREPVTPPAIACEDFAACYARWRALREARRKKKEGRL